MSFRLALVLLLVCSPGGAGAEDSKGAPPAPGLTAANQPLARSDGTALSQGWGDAHVPSMTGPTITVNAFQPGAAIKIIGYGDTRFTDPSDTKDTNPRMRKFLVDQLAQEAPDAVFETGDLPLIGSSSGDWGDYAQETAAWRQKNLRIYPTIGNHEIINDYEQAMRNYLAAFPILGGCKYYSVLIGNVYLLSVDEYTGIKPGSRQRAWIVSQLEHLPAQVDFVFVMNHQPLVNDLQSEVAVGLPGAEQVALRSLLEQEQPSVHKSFVVLSGHIHNYERYQRGAISYIITGGGGAKPYRIYVRGPEDLYRDTRFPVFNYVVFAVRGKHIDATMYRVADPFAPNPKMEVGERFTIDAQDGR